ncbi:hypothetical protein DFH29DRAFT_1001899 [Suillus ampliporus]|nr:hypothetical protein DFH29DRAFT_1001899 [Suillus ampliporus]
METQIYIGIGGRADVRTGTTHNAKLVDDSDVGTTMTSITFQQPVHIMSTGTSMISSGSGIMIGRGPFNARASTSSTISPDSRCCYMRSNDSTLRIGVETSTSRKPDDLGDAQLGDTELGGVDLEIHTSDEERVTHYGLKGRATNMFPVTSEALAKKFPKIEEDGMVAKIFWAEEQRTSEPEILSTVFDIVDKEQEIVKGHVPRLLWHCKVKTPTSTVR